MDYVKAALATVGLVQLIKNIVSLSLNSKVWTVITIVIAIGTTLAVTYLPSIVIDCILVLSGSSLFYDTIYKSFESFISGRKIKQEATDVNK